MSRSVYPTAQVPIEVQDESVATTLKVIMDVLKVSRLVYKILQAVLSPARVFNPYWHHANWHCLSKL